MEHVIWISGGIKPNVQFSTMDIQATYAMAA